MYNYVYSILKEDDVFMSKKCDVLIVGCGVAGLNTALSLPENLNIIILSKKSNTDSNSSLAQGGVAAVLDLENDSYELHINDTMIAGKHANDIDAVTTLVEEGPAEIYKIIGYGVEFDKRPDGELNMTLEGGHCRRRIVHHKDTTGAEMVRAMVLEAQKRKNITIIENTPVFKLTRVKSGICAHILTEDGQDEIFSSYCVLATGGIGRVYKYTTNPKVATGDGIRLAFELGARIKDLSFVQFHPTAFNSDDNEQFLISEAVRGEGAYLLNCNKERFMHRYDERLELAPRDVVSKSIIIESRKTGSNNFYLDITHRDKEYLLNRFPGIHKGCLRYKVDLNSRTTVSRLYAVGECSNTGVHGRNRLASNSLLEALVFGKRCADDIVRCIDMKYPEVQITEVEKQDLDGAPLLKGVRTEIRSIMQRSYFVMPANEDAVRNGYKRVREILTRLKNGKFKITPEYCEALSLATIAYIILKEVNDQ